MRFTVLEEIKSTLPKSLFHNNYSQIKSNQMLVFDKRENQSTRGKTSHGRVENQQTQSTCDTECEIETGPHWWKASALTTKPTLLQ